MEYLLGVLLLLGVLGQAPGDSNQLAVNPSEQIIQEISAEANTTTATYLLESLKEPEEKFAVAIYGIEDRTGQYKEEANMSNSRAVTQGATEMLVTALMRSKQFRVIDRIEFQQLLNEQNLKLQERVNDGPEIGALIGADYIIDGAITEYDVDRNTGGVGLKIAGKGVSKEYAKASCAIDMRVTDTSTGEVIWAKSLKKEILGEKVGVTVFSFMGDNIVEFETGEGEQEAINLVVRTLLEEIVYQLSQDIY